MTVRRTLPHRDVRTIGAWCFVDHYGPQQVDGAGEGGMAVPPHPHTGLQTVTWLLAGEVVHTDSLGSEQTIRPGQLNLMTAGRGIAHAEVSAAHRPGPLHGVQLWVALPDSARHGAPGFEHHATLPQVDLDGARTTVLLGELGGARSPAPVFSAIVGAALDLQPGATYRLPVDPGFEHGLLGLDGDVLVDGVVAPRGSLVGIAAGAPQLTLQSQGATQVLLIGGEPFDEDLVMWWNFVGRSHEEIVEARADWESGRFGAVAYDGAPLPAPALTTTRLLPRHSGGLPSSAP